MSAEDRQRTQQRAANRARNRAYRALSRQFPEEFHVLYRKEALAEGVVPNGVRREVAQALSRGAPLDESD